MKYISNNIYSFSQIMQINIIKNNYCTVLRDTIFFFTTF